MPRPALSRSTPVGPLSAYARMLAGEDYAPADPEQKSKLARLSPEMVPATRMAGDPILAKLTEAPCNHAPIGGLKVVSANGWFAARPSGTENVYKIYAESLKSAEHLAAIQAEAREIVGEALAA